MSIVVSIDDLTDPEFEEARIAFGLRLHSA